MLPESQNECPAPDSCEWDQVPTDSDLTSWFVGSGQSHDTSYRSDLTSGVVARARFFGEEVEASGPRQAAWFDDIPAEQADLDDLTLGLMHTSDNHNQVLADSELAGAQGQSQIYTPSHTIAGSARYSASRGNEGEEEVRINNTDKIFSIGDVNEYLYDCTPLPGGGYGEILDWQAPQGSLPQSDPAVAKQKPRRPVSRAPRKHGQRPASVPSKATVPPSTTHRKVLPNSLDSRARSEMSSASSTAAESTRSIPAEWKRVLSGLDGASLKSKQAPRYHPRCSLHRIKGRPCQGPSSCAGSPLESAVQSFVAKGDGFHRKIYIGLDMEALTDPERLALEEHDALTMSFAEQAYSIVETAAIWQDNTDVEPGINMRIAADISQVISYLQDPTYHDHPFCQRWQALKASNPEYLIGFDDRLRRLQKRDEGAHMSAAQFNLDAQE